MKNVLPFFKKKKEKEFYFFFGKVMHGEPKKKWNLISNFNFDVKKEII